MRKLSELLYIQMAWTLLFVGGACMDPNLRHWFAWPVYLWAAVLFLVSLRGQFLVRKARNNCDHNNCDHIGEIIAVYASAAKAVRKAKEKQA